MKNVRQRVVAFVAGLLLGPTLVYAGLETGTYISDLVATNPLGSDLASTLDDHIRLLKSTIKATFPNINNAVTVTDEQLNAVASNVAANPTGTVGLSTVNGSASTYLRSDGAPPLSQSIAPTWSATHRFSGGAAGGAGNSFPLEIDNNKLLAFRDSSGGFTNVAFISQNGSNALTFGANASTIATLTGTTANFTSTNLQHSGSRVNTIANDGRQAFGFVTGTTGALTRSLNVTSSSRSGTGVYSINVTAASFGATPVCVATLAGNGGGGDVITSVPSSSTTVGVTVITGGGAAQDQNFQFACYGT